MTEKSGSIGVLGSCVLYFVTDESFYSPGIFPVPVFSVFREIGAGLLQGFPVHPTDSWPILVHGTFPVSSQEYAPEIPGNYNDFAVSADLFLRLLLVGFSVAGDESFGESDNAATLPTFSSGTLFPELHTPPLR